MVETRIDAFQHVHQVLAGGDVLSPPHVRQFMLTHPQVALINGYGPTENTTFTACHRISRENIEATNSIPIGRPISNTYVYVLDGRLGLCAEGVPGELYIGGAGLARGYLGQTRLTAERFVPDSFGAPGGRLYRSGDLVRWLPDGTLQFLGRADHQIKIRGFRIEPGEIEETLCLHPAVRDAVVTTRSDASGARQLVAYVTQALPGDDEAVAWSRDHVAQWQALYDQTYAAPEAGIVPDFNITGWNSSYDGAAIPQCEMREWVEATVARISRLSPRRVLEIGCGTGLLALRLADTTERYVATDFSSIALSDLAEAPGLPPQIELMERMADDFSGFRPGDFDLVILNSVVQYFPSVDYLLKVLLGASDLLVSGGALFLGDLRHLSLLDAFHASVALHRAEAGTTADEIARRATQADRLERELCVDPGLFAGLRTRLGLGVVEVLAKRGQAANELTRFRYDAILCKAGEPTEATQKPVRWNDWHESEVGPENLAVEVSALLSRATAPFGLLRVPDRRSIGALAVRDTLAGGSRSDRAQLVEVAKAAEAAAIDPEALVRACEAAGWQAAIRPTAAHGGFDALLSPLDTVVCFDEPEAPPIPDAGLASYANQPLQGLFAERLAPELRSHLALRLPDHMVPQSFMVIDQIPLTANGKIDRKALPDPDGSRAGIAGPYSPPQTEIEDRLTEIWTQLLNLKRIGRHDNFFELGGDSIISIQIVARAKRKGIEIKPKDIFERQTIAELAEVAGQSTVFAEQGPVLGTAPLTPIHSWFLSQEMGNRDHFNQMVLLRLNHAVSAPLIQRVLRVVDAHHDIMRLRLVEQDGKTRLAFAAPNDEFPIIRLDMSAVRKQNWRAAIVDNCQRAQRSLSLTEGPGYRVVLLDFGLVQPSRLLFVMHHMLIDGVSWRLLMDDFWSVYAQALRGERLSLPPKTTSFKAWAERLAEYAGSAELRDEAKWWLEEFSQERIGSTPVTSVEAGANTVASIAIMPVTLTPDETSTLLLEVLSRLKTRIDRVLLAAFVLAYRDWSGRDGVLIDLEGHGREALFEDLDVSRTMGWFTTIHPLYITVAADDGPREALARVDQALDPVPLRGIGYGLLRQGLAGAEFAEALSQQPQAEISFNYLGQFNAVSGASAAVEMAPEPTGDARDPSGLRQHVLEVSGQIASGALEMELLYSSHLHDAQEIARLGALFTGHLRALIAYGANGEIDTLSAFQFETVDLDDDDLATILDQMGDSREKEL